MTSPKLLLALMATVASVQAAPQINEREVVGEVIQSLGPAIQQALASLGSSSSSSSSNFGSSPIVSRVSSTSSASRPQTSRRISINNPRLGPPALGTGLPPGVSRSDWTPSVSLVSSSAVSSGPSVSSVTSSVVSQLQPSIAAAVAEALKASSRPVSRPQASKPQTIREEPNYGPAKYNFGYKVADEESQAYINHQESREGNDVTGSYNYVNPAGALVTVNYEAGVDGFSQTRDVEQGAVQMRNIPGAWTGPLADVDEVAPVSNNRASVSSSSSQLSQEALISQILSTIQPKITSAVQGALSSSSQTAGRRTVVQQVAPAPAVRVAAPRPVASVSSSSSSQLSQEALISQILSSIQPKISSAVQGALSSQTADRRTVVQQVAPVPRPAVRVAAPRPIASRPRPGVIAPSTRRVQSSSSSSRGAQSSPSRGSGLGDVFGNGETSVKFATPQFQFEF